jgi:hypothetical protein
VSGTNSTYLICNTNAELLPRTLYLNSVRLYILLPSLRFVYYLYITHPGSEMALGCAPGFHPPSDDVIVGVSRHHSPPLASSGFFARPPPINTFWEDARLWEIPSLGHTPFRMTARGSRHLHFVHIFYLSYIIVILLARSKSVRINICEIKYSKNIKPCRTPRAIDPAKRDLKRTNIELAILGFCSGTKRACQLTARIDGIDRNSLFGNARSPCSRSGCSPSPRVLGSDR